MPNPRFATAVLAKRSLLEFSIAKIVAPRIASERRRIRPRVLRRETAEVARM
jgi:hypothetical protein